MLFVFAATTIDASIVVTITIAFIVTTIATASIGSECLLVIAAVAANQKQQHSSCY